MYIGSCSAEKLPSPNDQFHDVGDPAEVSLNCTVSGVIPEVGVPEKLATSGTVDGGVITGVGSVVTRVVGDSVGRGSSPDTGTNITKTRSRQREMIMTCRIIVQHLADPIVSAFLEPVTGA